MNVARVINAIYHPFNNNKLKNLVDEIQLTIISELGNVKYSGGDRTIVNNAGVVIKSAEFKIADKKDSKDVALTDSRIVKRVWTGDSNANEYLDMASIATWNLEKNELKDFTVKKKNSTLIVTPQTCKLTLTVTDSFGVDHATQVTVVVNKFE